MQLKFSKSLKPRCGGSFPLALRARALLIDAIEQRMPVGDTVKGVDRAILIPGLSSFFASISRSLSRLVSKASFECAQGTELVRQGFLFLVDGENAARGVEICGWPSRHHPL